MDQGELESLISLLEQLAGIENDPGISKGARSRASKLLKKYELTLEQTERVKSIVACATIRITTRPLTRADYQEAWHNKD